MVGCRWTIFLTACLRVTCAHPDFTVGLFLSSKGRHQQDMERLALQVSDPDSIDYGNYLSQADIGALHGVTEQDVEGARKWLEAALHNHSGRTALDTARISVVAHRDAVLADVMTFEASYQLGLFLASSDENTSAHLLPPSGVELLVTPGAPDGFCKKLHEKGKHACSSTQVCKWNVTCPSKSSNASGNGTPHWSVGRGFGAQKKSNASDGSNTTDATACNTSCTGDSDGWICWPDADKHLWMCFDMAAAESGDVRAKLAWRRRPVRKGRVWGAVESHRPFLVDSEAPGAASQRQSADLHVFNISRTTNCTSCNSSNTTTTTTHMPLRVFGMSESLLVEYKPNDPNATEFPYQALELSHEQSNLRLTSVLPRERWHWAKHTKAFFQVVPGVQNYRRLSKVSACVSSGKLPAKWCECDSTGMDEHGRNCTNIRGFSPWKDPVDFILPYPAQTLSGLHRDLGIPPGADAHFGVAANATHAVAEFSLQTFRQKDTDMMLRSYGLDPQRLQMTVEGPHPTNFSDPLDFARDASEGTLDVQILAALAPSVPLSWIGVHPYTLDGFMLAYALQVNNASTPPLVHSVSWGSLEAAFPPQFVKRLDYELMKLALRGISVLIASGDNGINAVGGDCTFAPDLAGASPWVTTVGATMHARDASPVCHATEFQFAVGVCEESGPVVCSTTAGALITSGGYWSIYRGQPTWQAAAVGAHANGTCAPCATGLSSNLTAATSENPFASSASQALLAVESLVRTKRAGADVAAPGHSYLITLGGVGAVEDGTSASAPAMAALVSLLNAEQLRRGRPPLGFINPWLYSVHRRQPSAFLDVTVGAMDATEVSRCDWGFRAAPGWDPPTGLGVPQFDRLLPELPVRSATWLPELAALVQDPAASRPQVSDNTSTGATSSDNSRWWLSLFTATMAAAGTAALTWVWGRTSRSGGSVKAALDDHLLSC